MDMERDEVIQLWEDSNHEWKDIEFIAHMARTDTETIVEVLRQEGIRVAKMYEQEKQKATLKKPLTPLGEKGQMAAEHAQVPKDLPDVVVKACQEKINALRASISGVELQIKELQEFIGA